MKFFIGIRDGSFDRSRIFAFGSSTPRQFAHLNMIIPYLRVYDVKIWSNISKRSETTPIITASRSKTGKVF